MCGITGIYGMSSEKSASTIRLMNNAISHRGPDDEGYYVDEQVALGHRRLAIIDLSPAGHQPMHSNDGNLEIAFNGEIYNFQEVKKLLSGYAFKSGSDTEVILAAYQQWGKDCLQHFNGMFAFAIWDKAKQELFIARDRLGIKPVYYFRQDKTLLFSSEIRSLLQSGIVPRKINSKVIYEYFTYQTIHAPETFINNVFMLMPGHYMTVNASGINIERYWHIVENTDFSSSGKSYQEVCADINKLFFDAVNRRLISDVPFGAFLSGGIDSSAVVGAMSRIHSQPVKTFTIAFDESDFSEAKFAKLIADKFKTDHHEFLLKPEDFLNQLPEAMNALDHPSGDGPNSYIVSKITRQAGVTMALSGLGGDELFAGYPVFKRTELLQQKSWLWKLPLPLRQLLGKLITTLKQDTASIKQQQLLLSPDASLQYSFPVSRQVSNAKQLASFIEEKFNGIDAVQEIVRELNKHKALPLFSQVSAAEISSYMQNVLLRDTDQMSMAVALEVRVPFLDYKLVEYVMGVNDEYKNPVYPKKLLVDSLGDLLPDEVVHRKKMGFVFPWERWLKKELHTFCGDRIYALANRGFMNKEALNNRWQSFNEGKPGVRWLDMWLCVVLEHWLEKNNIEY
ncbi:MAG TPA: asparagine synthase (glutamine-hydrolyzing) [Bacteroidia bacterium]|nr:asparagine synthase (glutamine-hydrolyzing) [Bacteroidia bacterium]MBP7715293.1 asparagine synthase (glutamine-hydrolyzing) [Bacteroidia bacterium]MBP8669563.1 asparagine synthase (glutamine-hydrolyzing) [Bacteroidia bacterium]HOZ82783.1 asparagine synthase (glutamine-hydrolyzing) [Bacteroidia bacterium]HQW18775.1 asparagine synthase (glutamine-hydrolyzing) [Bacteroidia bacterium]